MGISEQYERILRGETELSQPLLDPWHVYVALAYNNQYFCLTPRVTNPSGLQVIEPHSAPDGGRQRAMQNAASFSHRSRSACASDRCISRVPPL